MDSLDLSDTQSTPLNNKNNVFIKNPGGCACCGLKDYPKNIPPAHCFTTLYPKIPGCKRCQDHLQDNFAIPHPFFAGFPFQQQFFQSTIIPPNFYCSQKVCHDEDKIHEQKQSQGEHETAHGPESQKEKTTYDNNKSIINEGVQKNNPNLRSETSLPYSKETETQFDPLYQRCICGDCIALSYRPFIMPVFSYCLLWNSQMPSTNLSPKTYNSHLKETTCQKKSENLPDKTYSNSNETKERLNIKKEAEVVNMRDDSNHDVLEIAHCVQKSLLVSQLSESEPKKEDQRTEIEDMNSGFSTAAETFDTIKSQAENSFKVAEQEEINEYLENDSDDSSEEEDISEDESESGEDVEVKDHSESEESLTADETDPENESLIPNLNTNSYKGSECNLSLDRESSSDFKKTTAKSSELSLSGSFPENQTDVYETYEINLVRTPPNEASEEKISDDEDLNISRTSLKKCIKNFTVTNEISDVLPQEEESSAAAAGDLGGEILYDHNKPISDQSETHAETPSEENHESNELYMGNEENETDKVSDKNVGENAEENQNSGLKYKSGIAKLLNNSSPKTSKTNSLKNIKNCKNDSNTKQNSVKKHKLCCFYTNTTNSPQDERKPQRTKNCAAFQCQALGSEKQQKLLSKSQPLKKGNSSQKAIRDQSLVFKKSKKVQ